MLRRPRRRRCFVISAERAKRAAVYKRDISQKRQRLFAAEFPKEQNMSDTDFRRNTIRTDHSSDGGTIIGKTDARQAVTLGSMRYVLGISLALALVAFVVLYFMYL
jgi:hypothetical protein